VKHKVAGVIASLVVFIATAELLSLTWYWLGYGGFFYANKETYPLVEQPDHRSLTRDAVFHPYFGWVKAHSDVVNNHGFYSAINYPFVRESEKQYVIGVFGGSVALHFQWRGRKQFLATLEQSPFFADKEIVLLNFSGGGYEQPQQLLILSYYLTVNIDGFNELALSSRNNEKGLDLAMPNADLMFPMINLMDATLLTPERIESLARIKRYRDRLNYWTQRMNSARISSVYFVSKQLYKISHNRYYSEIAAYSEIEENAVSESMIGLFFLERPLSEAEFFETAARQWANASILMHQALEGRSIPYLHILQPNQYYSGRDFSEEEARIALDENSFYASAASSGYPYLIAESDRLWQSGVRFLNAVELFDDEPQIVYEDTCCHFNQLGNDMFAELIADWVLQNIGTESD
jgi:hypothetical protein